MLVGNRNERGNKLCLEKTDDLLEEGGSEWVLKDQ